MNCYFIELINLFKQFMSSIQMLISSVIFMALPTNFFATIGVRMLSGFSFGCSYLSSLMYASEISSPAVRIQNLYLVHFSITLGMFLHAAFVTSGIFYLMGSVSIALIVVSLPFIFFKTLPSPTYLMHRGSKDIIERTLYFSSQVTVSDKMHIQLGAMQSHVLSENNRPFNFCSYHNTTSLLIVIFIKIGYFSVFNIITNYLRTLFMRAFLMEYTEMTSLGTRLLGAILGFFLLDRVAKKWQFALTSFASALILIGFGCLLTFELVNYIWTPLAFFLPLEFLIGIGIGGMSEISKAEIFPLRERKASMAFTYFFEEILHISSIIIHYGYVFTLGSNPSFWPFIFAPFTISSGIYVLFAMKDSRKETLRETSLQYAIPSKMKNVVAS